MKRIISALACMLFVAAINGQPTGGNVLPPTGPKPQVSIPTPIIWACDFKGTRVGRVGGVIWAYCFGVDDAKTYVRKRVILGGGITAAMESDAISWVKTGSPDLWAVSASSTIWASSEAAQARQAIEDSIAAEKAAGTMPMPAQWRVAPNPSSTSIPPTRPMFLATDTTKTVKERAYVGDLCDCSKPSSKGTQTLCRLRQLGEVVPSDNLTACLKQ